MRHKSSTLLTSILQAIGVALIGFILLNLTFLLDFVFQSIADWIMRLFTSADTNMMWGWFPPVKHALFVILICTLSWFVLRSRLGEFYKATYMTVPIAVVLATIGILLHRNPLLALLTGVIFCIGVLFYLYRNKRHWLYTYALILVSLAMLLMMLFGVDI
jgi:hypothetical protein